MRLKQLLVLVQECVGLASCNISEPPERHHFAQKSQKQVYLIKSYLLPAGTLLKVDEFASFQPVFCSVCEVET